MELKKQMKEELDSIAERLGLKDISETFYFPKYFEIETIRACNAFCDMCTVNEWEDKNNRMDDQLFAKFVKEVANYSDWVNRVCLSRNGEPLLDRNLAEKVKTLKQAGVKEVSFSTNASILSEEKAIELIEAGLDDIRFSIDGITKETFESIRKGLNYEKVKENCLRFIEIRNRYGDKPKIHIRMTLQEKNKHEEKEFNEFWSSKILDSDVVSSKPMHSWGNQLDNYEKNNLDKQNPFPCISLWSTIVVHFDGKIPLCGCDFNNKRILGDFNEQSVKEIWNSENLNKLRGIHSSGRRNEIPLCIGCNVWDEGRKKIYNEEME